MRLKPDAVRQLGLTPTAARREPARLRQRRRRHLLDAPDGEQVEVELRLPQACARERRPARRLPVAYAKDGTPIPLAQRRRRSSPVDQPRVVIKRQDLQRRQAIYAGIDEAGRARDVGADVQKIIKDTAAAARLPLRRRRPDAATSRRRSAASVSRSALAVIFIYIVLATQFGSFLQPLAIMASLPLALIGVMLALSSPLDAQPVLDDRPGHADGPGDQERDPARRLRQPRRKAGLSRRRGPAPGRPMRMRPIIMTTAAMIFGMLPLALALDEGGELQAPMGRAIIGGVITSTLLTLVVVPVIYSYLVRDKRRGAPVRQGAGRPPRAGGAIPRRDAGVAADELRLRVPRPGLFATGAGEDGRQSS